MPPPRPVEISLSPMETESGIWATAAVRDVTERLENPVREVEDGQQLLELRRRQGEFAADLLARGWILVFLDINMPRMNGLEALAEIKADPALRGIPIVMLTTSEAETDMLRAYDLGANSYIFKPVSFSEFPPRMKQTGEYWIQLATLPPRSLH
ncbi:MAG: response regulator [Solimonas sp.]